MSEASVSFSYEKFFVKGNKNIIVSQTEKSADRFISRVNSLFKVENIIKTKLFPFFYICETFYNEYLPSLFICVETIETFLIEINKLSQTFNKQIQLNTFTLTFLYPQSINETSIKALSFFAHVYGIKHNKQSYMYPIKEITLNPLVKHQIQMYLMLKHCESRSCKIFKVIKDKHKYRKRFHIKFRKLSNTMMNPHSLVYISKEVKKYLFINNNITNVDVTNYIVNVLRKNKSGMSFKNIQRRVYDVINVMISLGLVLKKGKVLYRNEEELQRMKVDIEVKKKELGNEVKRLGCCVGEKGIEEVVGKEGLNDLKKWKLCSYGNEDGKRKGEVKNCEKEGNWLFNVDFEKYLTGDASCGRNKECFEKRSNIFYNDEEDKLMYDSIFS